MSLILEALRKSEAERRRGNTPDVAMELPPAALRARNATPAWLWPVVVAAIIVVALAWWLAGRRDTAQPAAPAVDRTATESAPAAAPAVVPSAAVAAPATTATAPAQTTKTPEPDVIARPVAASQQPAATPARELPPPPPIALPPAPTSTSMPGVKLSMHMWDASADKRFVILNGQRMGEGDRNGDVQVVAIEYLAAVQGCDLHAPMPSSPPLERARGLLRAQVPTLDEDRYFAPDIAAAAALVRSGALVAAVAPLVLPAVESRR